MPCLYCGAPIPLGGKFCGKCGKRQDVEASAPLATSAPARSVASIGRSSLPLANPDLKVRTLFVIGTQSSRDSEAWLRAKFPNSQVMKFSTVGAVREAVLRMAKSKAIESLCLIGTAKTVPPHRLHDDSEFVSYQRSHRDKNFKPVESDLFYCSEKLSLQNLPTQDAFHSSGAVEAHYLKLDPIQAVGVVPVGRIPFDDFSDWKSYLEREVSCTNPFDASWVAVSDASESWVWECKTVFDNIKVDSLLCCVPDEAEEFVERCADGDGLEEGTRLLVNLHGGWPTEGRSQILVDNDGNPFDITDIKNFSSSTLFLFSCYGGNSGWWNSTGAIYNFFVNGGVAAVASSTSVWCSDPSESEQGEVPPGAVQLCAEFFRATNEGMNLGEALNYAKIKTMADAIARAESWFFCKAVKEVLQFSLYGAPWLYLTQTQKNPTQPSIAQSKNASSMLDKVRNGLSLNQIRSQGGGDLLGEIRERLMASIGPTGVDFFSQTREYALKTLQNKGSFEQLQAQLDVEGFNIYESHFELISWGGTTQQILTVSGAEDVDNQLMVFLDEAGSIIKSMKMKGGKNDNR